ncbi:hypothetical protein RGAI101_2384 [Roseobacter sp. GAI101]|nr:hypothetical protein RGAI101_2384 [Roseobacter sp. GAI101]
MSSVTMIDAALALSSAGAWAQRNIKRSDLAIFHFKWPLGAIGSFHGGKFP